MRIIGHIKDRHDDLLVVFFGLHLLKTDIFNLFQHFFHFDEKMVLINDLPGKEYNLFDMFVNFVLILEFADRFALMFGGLWVLFFISGFGAYFGVILDFSSIIVAGDVFFESDFTGFGGVGYLGARIVHDFILIFIVC